MGIIARRYAFVCIGIGILAASPGIADDGYSVPMAVRDLDPDALDAARRYFAMPSMQALSIARHDPTVIAHRIEQALPERIMTESQREAMIELTMEEFSGMKAESDETTIRVLAHVYTAEELDAMIAFEQTEIGQRIAEKRPIYSILNRDAKASLRREALGRIVQRLTGVETEPNP